VANADSDPLRIRKKLLDTDLLFQTNGSLNLFQFPGELSPAGGTDFPLVGRMFYLFFAKFFLLHPLQDLNTIPVYF
jgi:hypothetical protein